MTLFDHVELWNSPEMVVFYSAKPYLFPAERFVFRSYFPDGLIGQRALDLGCGGGRVTHFLREMGADVVGADISRNLIHVARQRDRDIDFCLGDAALLPFDEESFDVVVFAHNSLDCVYPKDERIKACHEVARVLRPGGLFIFSSHNFAALVFGWYRYLRSPRKLIPRTKFIINGSVFKSEGYLRGVNSHLPTYHSWPRQLISDLRLAGFELISIHTNSRLLGGIQRTIQTNWLTKLADPWPYYVFRKTATQHLDKARSSTHPR